MPTETDYSKMTDSELQRRLAPALIRMQRGEPGAEEQVKAIKSARASLAEKVGDDALVQDHLQEQADAAVAKEALQRKKQLVLAIRDKGIEVRSLADDVAKSQAEHGALVKKLLGSYAELRALAIEIKGGDLTSGNQDETIRHSWLIHARHAGFPVRNITNDPGARSFQTIVAEAVADPTSEIIRLATEKGWGSKKMFTGSAGR